MFFNWRDCATNCLAIIVSLVLWIETIQGRHPTGNRTSKTEIVPLEDNVYAGCNNGSSKRCFGIFGGNCSTLRTCSHGITIAENKTHIEIVRFQSPVHRESSKEKGEEHRNYSYVFRLSVDPFVNNGMGTLEPKCKKQLQPSDFILRIFRFPNNTLGVRKNRDDVKKSIWLRKSDWRKLCKEDILREYNSRITTFDTRYIVFQNKFYYDIDTESLGSYVVPDSNLEDFKDPDLYSTTDGLLFLNFNFNHDSPDSNQSTIFNTSGAILGSHHLLKSSTILIYFLLIMIR